jgi:D-glucosaminate-6-phosphate ammonia-lyase
MKRLILVVAAIALAAAVPVLAQDQPKEKKADVTGSWEVSVESPQGTMTLTATYKQDGEKLTGTHVGGPMGDEHLEGTVKGNEIAYKITIDVQGQQFTLSYAGKIDGDAITGTVDFGGMGSSNWTAKRKK